MPPEFEYFIELKRTELNEKPLTLDKNANLLPKILSVHACDTGSIEREPGHGHPRATTAREDRHLSIIARLNRGAAASQLSRYLYAATETRLSRVTISKRLYERGLFAKRLAVCVPLTHTNRSVHLAGSIEIGVWTNGRSFCSPTSPVSA
ncbi:HTH_Tnp_Tc3_2 domain-containing protein [Trichonephila clavipes]|nr:HTH_Tnp_Tc3_2 domain-containing protein [Trichonephila clavipes]